MESGLNRDANLHQWQIVSLDKCPHMMNHVLESCPLAELVDNGVLQLHSAADNAVTCLRDMAMNTLVK